MRNFALFIGGFIFGLAQLPLAWFVAGRFLKNAGAIRGGNRYALATLLSLSWFYAEAVGSLLTHIS